MKKMTVGAPPSAPAAPPRCATPATAATLLLPASPTTVLPPPPPIPAGFQPERFVPSVSQLVPSSVAQRRPPRALRPPRLPLELRAGGWPLLLRQLASVFRFLARRLQAASRELLLLSAPVSSEFKPRFVLSYC